MAIGDFNDDQTTEIARAKQVLKKKEEFPFGLNQVTKKWHIY